MLNTEKSIPPIINSIHSLYQRLNQDYQPLEAQLEELKKNENFSINQLITRFKVPKKNVESPLIVEHVINFLGDFDSKIAEINEDHTDDKLKNPVTKRIIKIQQGLSKLDKTISLSNQDIKKMILDLKLESLLTIILNNFETGYCIKYSEKYLLLLNQLLTSLSIYTKEMEVNDHINFDYTFPRDQREYTKPEFDRTDIKFTDHIAQINRYAYFINECLLVEADVYAYHII